MRSFIAVTFLVLGWSWFELSGGADFQPGQHGVTMMAQVKTPAEPIPEVTRTALDLSSILKPEAAVAPAQDTPVLIKASVGGSDLITSPAPVETRLTNTLTVAALTAVVDVPDVEYRVVSGTRVNLRSGPGTTHAVVAQLVRDQEVEILTDEGDGWVKLRALDGNDIGWMSGKFLAATD